MGQYCILIHYHELGLKKKNRTWFEKIFQKNINTHLKSLPFQNINTYEDSIAPHQDCCAFFTPIHPELKGHVKKIEYIESTLDTDSLYKEIIDKREVYKT